MKRSIPILLYHHISPDRDITPAGFERQLRSLLDQGYRSLSVNELLAVVRGESEPQQPGFVVTIDDGYLNNWVYAFPILQKLSVKAIIYLVTERLDTENFLTWDQVRSMASSGLVEFGSHTHTHRQWKRAQRYEDVRQELEHSKQRIETELKKPCVHLAWPWGDYETEWWPMLKELGYQTAMTTQAGANAEGTHPYALKRFKVSREDLDWLSGRVRWNSRALAAQSYAWMYGWDKRIKSWLKPTSPYSHG